MTSYSTLELTEDGQQPRKFGKLAVIAASLVAFAGLSAMAGGTMAGSPSGVTNNYDAMKGTPVNCDENSATFHDELPKWDPAFNTAAEEFYNACYYSFRCCTSTGNGNGCYVSNNYGDNCKGCLANNGPNQVRLDCKKWLLDDTVEEKDWNTKELMADQGIPETEIPLYKVSFKAIAQGNNSCWSQGSANSYKEFADKCFEVISWCNLLCPRDTPQTVDHVMCKHCTLFGFSESFFDAAAFEAELPDTDFTNGEKKVLNHVE